MAPLGWADASAHAPRSVRAPQAARARHNRPADAFWRPKRALVCVCVRVKVRVLVVALVTIESRIQAGEDIKRAPRRRIRRIRRSRLIESDQSTQRSDRRAHTNKKTDSRSRREDEPNEARAIRAKPSEEVSRKFRCHPLSPSSTTKKRQRPRQAADERPGK